MTRQGVLPLVIEAHSADIIATLILLKREVEREIGSDIKMTISGATEAHLLAKELAQAAVGVIVRPSRPFPYVWEDRRLCVTLVFSFATMLISNTLQLAGSPSYERQRYIEVAFLQRYGWHWHRRVVEC